MNNKNKRFKQKPKRQIYNFNHQEREAQIEKITMENTGELISISGLIDSITQTSGPTLFSITDGTGVLILKGFESPGARAYPFIKEEDAVQATVKINEYNGMLEGEIKKIQKLTPEQKESIYHQIEQIERKRAEPERVNFLVKSPILDKLREKFIEAAREIKLAIIQNRPIIVRHHNDTDGYSAGYALEKAILPLIEKQHGEGKSAWEFYLRAPCAAPFYEIEDSIRDTAMSLRNEAKFSNKMPMIIIADNGSSPEDLLAIKQGKVHGINFVVIDHHYFDKDVISQEVSVHINPFLVGEDGAKFSAGMLCTELARFIAPAENLEQIPALAGLADRINNPPVLDEYLKIAAKKGYNKSLLLDIATVIDFISSKLRFMEAREYIEVLFGEPMSKQKTLVALLAPYINGLENKGLEIAKNSVKTEKINKTTLQLLFIEEIYSRGFYPKPGKCNGLLHDYAQEKKGIKNIVSAAILSDMVTIRASDEANFSVHEFILFINKKIPDAFPEGGGHKNAGAIKFVPNKQKEIITSLKEFIKIR
ncbi:MAG: hypothetical protein AABX73_03535 [Nanoarchaeota archaeon]